MSVAVAKWEAFRWYLGGECYCFEIALDGSLGRFAASDGQVVVLPLRAWKAFFDAVLVDRDVLRKDVKKGQESAGKRWTEAEKEELRAGFRDGRQVRSLARDHHRTPWAIQCQLEKLGLVPAIERDVSTEKSQAIAFNALHSSDGA